MLSANPLLLPPGKPRGGTAEWVCDCPFCGRQGKFGFNLDKEAGNCFICHATCYNTSYWVSLYDNLTEADWERAYRKPPVEHLKEDLVCAWRHTLSRQWCLGRGITEQTCWESGLLYDTRRGELVLEVNPTKPLLQACKIRRRIRGLESKWLSCSMMSGVAEYYGYGTKTDFTNRRVLIVEGVGDLLATGLHRDGIAILGSKVKSAWYRWIRDKTRGVVWWFDPDDAGETAADEVQERCAYYGLDSKVIKSDKDPKHYNPLLKQDKAFIDSIREMLCAS